MARNFNPAVKQRMVDILAAGGQSLPDDLADQIVPIVDITPTDGDAAASVKLTDGTDTAVVESDGKLLVGVPLPSAGQTLINISGTGNGANQTIRTVAAGKKFYVFGLACNAGATSIYLYATDGTTRRIRLDGTASYASQLLASAVPIASWAAGENVIVWATNTAQYNVWGIEVTA